VPDGVGVLVGRIGVAVAVGVAVGVLVAEEGVFVGVQVGVIVGLLLVHQTPGLVTKGVNSTLLPTMSAPAMGELPVAELSEGPREDPQ
jgi:hypothetical protein